MGECIRGLGPWAKSHKGSGAKIQWGVKEAKLPQKIAMLNSFHYSVANGNKLVRPTGPERRGRLPYLTPPESAVELIVTDAR